MKENKRLKANDAAIPALSPVFKNAALNPGGEFELALSAEQLGDILDNKTRTITFDPQEQYETLSPANQKALRHLVRASNILNDVYLKQDHADNIRARKILKAEAATGNETAAKALALFDMHNGVVGLDMYAKKSALLPLFKNKSKDEGRGLYPQDATADEIASYVVDHPEAAAGLLANNTIVRRKGKAGLIAVPYSVAFSKEMNGAAKELLAAARETDHQGLAEYLRWQAQALVNDSDPEAMYRADKAWINLKDSPLEFTVGRESYDDMMSKSVIARPEVSAVLKANGIKAKPKDTIGVRVGIVNKVSDAEFTRYRQLDSIVDQAMPYRDEYAAKTAAVSVMNFADVDLVAFSGRYAALRGGIAVAQNLPNSDKLAVQMNEGSRMVFHRTVRQSADAETKQKFLDALIDPSQHHLYDEDADFRFTISHETGHPRGPKISRNGQDKKGALGRLGDIIEENKADMASLLATELMEREGALTTRQAHSIYLTWAARGILTKEPSPEEAHRVRAVMQMNYFRERGAIHFEAGGRLSIVPEKMVWVSRQMLADTVALQLSGDVERAGAFVAKYSQWNETMQHGAGVQMAFKPRLYKMLHQPLRDKLSI